MVKKTTKKTPRRKTVPPRSIDPAALRAAIRERAHQIHLERGEASGGEMDDWLRAEREILTSEGAATSDR